MEKDRIYVIVHLADLKRAALNRPSEKGRIEEILEKIKEIKNGEHDLYEIGFSEDPSDLPVYIPPPEEVEVYLCGCHSWGCLVEQRAALRRKGYEVHELRDAIYPDSFIWPVRFEYARFSSQF